MYFVQRIYHLQFVSNHHIQLLKAKWNGNMGTRWKVSLNWYLIIKSLIRNLDTSYDNKVHGQYSN